MHPTLVYYGTDGSAAKARAAEIRRGRGPAQVRHAAMFDGPEPCACVVLMPDVVAWDGERIRAAYGDLVEHDWPATDLSALREEYRRVVGRRPYHGWDADTLKAKMAEAGDGA